MMGKIVAWPSRPYTYCNRTAIRPRRGLPAPLLGAALQRLELSLQVLAAPQFSPNFATVPELILDGFRTYLILRGMSKGDSTRSV
jgi:hypothetical protein